VAEFSYSQVQHTYFETAQYLYTTSGYTCIDINTQPQNSSTKIRLYNTSKYLIILAPL